MQLLGFRIPMSASLLVWALLWEAAGRAGITILIPPLSSVILRLGEIVPTETFLDALALTIAAFAAGTGLSIVIGVPLGLAMGRIPTVDRLLLPWVNVFVSAPLSALVPVLMALFGFGETAIVLTVLLFALWIIVLDARAGARDVAPSLVEMARSYGAGRWQLAAKIILRAALPEILTGIRLGAIRAVKGVIVGQLLISVIGFGHLFEIYSSNFLMEHMWALLLVLFALAFALDTLLGYFERRVEYYAAMRS
jgi:NitT/TauT family transport system permease protein